MWESLVRIDLNFEGDLDVRPNICKDRSRERFNEDHDLLKMKQSHIKLKLLLRCLQVLKRVRSCV